MEIRLRKNCLCGPFFVSFFRDDHKLIIIDLEYQAVLVDQSIVKFAVALIGLFHLFKRDTSGLIKKRYTGPPGNGLPDLLERGVFVGLGPFGAFEAAVCRDSHALQAQTDRPATETEIVHPEYPAGEGRLAAAVPVGGQDRRRQPVPLFREPGTDPAPVRVGELAADGITFSGGNIRISKRGEAWSDLGAYIYAIV